MSDKNLISITCQGDAVFVNGLQVHDAPIVDGLRVISFDELVAPDLTFSDALKFSGAHDLFVMVRRIVGGKEDCIDINNRCRNLVIEVGELEPKGRFAVTTKGESKEIRLKVGRLVGHGKETDFDYGNRSEQAKGRTTHCHLEVDQSDSPAKVRIMHAWKPTLSGNASFKVNTTLKGWISRLFWFFPLLFSWTGAVILATVALSFASGCSNPDRPLPSAQVPTTAGVMAKQEKKDSTVLEAAGRIEENNAAAPASPQQPLIQADVEVIRGAIASAPAVDLAPIIAAVQVLAAERDALRKQNGTLQRELAEAKDSVWRTVQLWGSGILYGLGVIGLLMIVLRAKAAFSTGLNVLDAVKSCAMLATLAASFFATARFMSSDYFWYAIGGVLALGAGYIGFLVWNEQKAKAAVRALKPIVKALDDAYESADDMVKKDLDSNVFSKLSAEMKQVPGAKSLIHSVRAESAATT